MSAPGEALWGCEVHPGTVLYLALEDDFQRIQSRMFMMYGVNDTDRLHFATAAGKIGNGLDEQLENFVREHPDTKLIIIDTMQKIREVGGEAYSYASDYEIIGRLKQFADKHCICVLTVHHTRKQPAGDSFEMISGTTGLLGCADGSLLMQKKKRTALEATIDVVGRDQQDQILYLKKDADTQIWNLEKVENELHKEPPDHVLEAVAETGVRRTAGVDRLALCACRCRPCRHGGKCAEQVSECEVWQAAGRIPRPL